MRNKERVGRGRQNICKINTADTTCSHAIVSFIKFDHKEIQHRSLWRLGRQEEEEGNMERG